MGNVTLRDALAHSLNVATVKLAEETGYGMVVDLARRAGMNLDIHPTPAVALGAYEVTPLEIAGRLHDFRQSWHLLKAATSCPTSPAIMARFCMTTQPEHRDVLDPRVAFLMDQLMEEVVRSGTGASVWCRGINFPIAGKTGTSHDGWFAGFTSKLICIVWVGFDDNRELNLEGAHSALPVWAEFMRRAHEHREYRNVSGFRGSGRCGGRADRPANPGNWRPRLVPRFGPSTLSKARSRWSCASCTAAAERVWPVGDTTTGHRDRTGTAAAAAAPAAAAGRQRAAAEAQAPAAPDSTSQPQEPRKHKGFFERLRGIFK